MISKKIKTNQGFTLIELLASVFIIALISGVFMVNYQNTNKRSQLKMSAQKLVSDIRLAQNYSLGSKAYNGTNTPTGGWGAHFNLASPGQYIIFADIDGDHAYGADDAGEVKNLPAGVVIDSLSPGDMVDIVFLPPDPITYVNASPAAGAQITLKEGVNNSTAAVRVNSFGLIDVQ
ncbi:MAG: type II secretion system protein [bacterium]|nr:type II secretion system protein [bacterium]